MNIGQVGVHPVSGDASFRRYFRLRSDKQSWILMDAPPDKEHSAPFVDIAARLRRAGLHAPDVIAADLDRGYLLLEDLGDALYKPLITNDPGQADRVDGLFEEAFAALHVMASSVSTDALPPYDRTRLLEELELFPAWYLKRHRNIALSCGQWDLWEALCTQLIQSAQQQPQVFVHRDFHSCNLLKTPFNSPGIIDFQDAVVGPVSYDLISLVWDRYITWPRDKATEWFEQFRQRLGMKTDPQTWLRWCDWMGLQRNLKVVGIFARLHHRDGKAGYLEMIPRFWDYVIDQLGRYPEFQDFHKLLNSDPYRPR